MLQRNPKLPNELPPTAEVLHHRETQAQEAADERFQKYLTKRRRWIALGKAAVGTGLFINAAIAPYLGDVRANMIESADARPSVQIIANAIDPENSDHATVFFHGFNTYGARHLTNTIGPGYQAAIDGQLWSMQYNNAPLDNHFMSEALIEKFNEEGITSVDFVLYSQGGVAGSAVITDIIEKTWVDVENVTYASSPSSFDTLTEKTKEEIGIAKDMAWIPWIEYSTLFRLGAEAYFYRNEMQNNFATASGGIMTRYNNGNMTNNLFLGSQINAMVEADVPSEIEQWGEYADEKFIPSINFALTESDIVVNNRASISEICPAARKIGSQCIVRAVNARHGEYYLPKSVEEYNRVFQELADVTKPYIMQEASRQALNLYYLYQKETFTFEK